TTDIRHPDVTVQLSGEDGNVFFIIGRVSKALRRAGYTEDAEAYRKNCMAAKSYDEVLQITMATVETE
ncbi:MAG: hypothetical protein Q7J84_15080, partial [Sulfuricaulis sp.]|nr:hypothetical protein [Sulfuricaulis sp.]